MKNMLPLRDLFDEIQDDMARVQGFQPPLKMFLRQELRRLIMTKFVIKHAAASLPIPIFSQKF